MLASMDAGIKLVADTVPAGQIWLFRASFSLFPMAVYIFWIEAKSLKSALTTANLPLQILRGMFGAATFLAFVFAIRNAELSAVAAFALTAPLIMFLLGVRLLNERGTPQLLSYALLGCAAAFLMVPVSNDITRLGAFFAFLSAVFHALASVTGRVLIRQDSGSTIALYTNLVALVCSTLFVCAAGWTLVTLRDLTVCAAVGLFGGASYLTLAIAMKYLEVARAAVIEYSFYAWAALFGAVLFSEFPSSAQVVSVAIILFCCFLTTRKSEVT